MPKAWIGLGPNMRPYEPKPLPEGACRLCFNRGWFLAPDADGGNTPMKCDKCGGAPASPTAKPKQE